MRKIALLLLLFPLSVFSQQISAVRVSDFDRKADTYVGSDSFGFHYFIKDNVFIKTDGKSSLEYRKLAAGKIARADIENPLLILLFYENFNTAVLLDNQLNEVKEIDFSKLSVPVTAHAAGIASQNRLWIYDSLTQQLGFYDYIKNTWQPITTPQKENLKYYQSDFNEFYWIDAKSGWYACDIYGKISALGKIAGFDRIRLVDDHSYFAFEAGRLYYHDAAKNSISEVAGIDNSLKNFYYKDQILSIFTGSGITNYKIILP